MRFANFLHQSGKNVTAHSKLIVLKNFRLKLFLLEEPDDLYKLG